MFDSMQASSTLLRGPSGSTTGVSKAEGGSSTSAWLAGRARRWDHNRDGVRAWLFDFRFNHRAFMPPGAALPASYRQAQSTISGQRPISISSGTPTPGLLKSGLTLNI